MSIITRNQITIFDVLDGEPGPQGPQGAQGPQGDQGPQGVPGQDYNLYTGSWYIGADGQGFDFSFPPVHSGMDLFEVKVYQNDLEGHIRILCNGNVVTSAINGTNAVTEWNGFSIDPGYLSDSADNLIRIEHDGSGIADWGYIYKVALLYAKEGPQGVQGLQGIQGPQGDQGIQGPAGSDGLPSYFHVKYANDAAGSGMNEVGGEYIGTYVDHTAADSSDPAAYTWVLVKGSQGLQGDQGIPGVDGSDGSTAYLHIKYSDDGGVSFTGNNGEDSGQWIGQYTDHTAADSASVSSYAWTKIKGDQGDPGAPGTDGQSLYTWTAYADDADGTGISISSTGKKYIGYAYNQAQAQNVSLTPSGPWVWKQYIQNFVTTDLQVTDDGVIRSGYSAGGDPPPSGKGFFLGADGRFKAYQGEFSGQVYATSGVFQNSIVYGRLIHDSLETVEQQSGSTIPAVTPSNLLWAESDFYAGFNVSDSENLQAITANSWNGKTPTHATKRSNSRVLLSSIDYNNQNEDSQVVESGTYPYLKTPVKTLTVSSNIRRVTINQGYARCLVTADKVYLKICLNDEYSPPVYESSTTSSSGVLNFSNIDIEVQGGDTLLFYVLFESSQYSSGQCTLSYDTEKQYSQTFSGLVFKYSDGSIGTAVANVSTKFHDTTWSSSSPAFSASSILSRKKGDSLIDGITGLGTSFLDCVSGSITINVNTYTVDRIRKLSDRLEIISGSSTYTVLRFASGTETGAYTALSTTDIVPVSQAAGVSVKTISPKAHNTYDLGSSTNQFREIHGVSIYGGAVYGAVGNDFVDNIEAPGGWRYGYAHIVNRVYYGIPSDTSSVHAGTERPDTMPRAVSGFVLVYVDDEYPVNTKLTYRNDGVLTKKHLWSRKPVVALYYKRPERRIWNLVDVRNRHIVKVVF